MTTSYQVTGLSFTEDQLAARRLTLGASEVAAVAGLNPHRTALDVWLEKTGRAEPFTGNQFTEWGLRLEDVICAKYAEVHKVILLKPGTFIGEESWMSCTPDRLIDMPTDSAYYAQITRWGLEAKNKGARQAVKWGESGTDQIPHDVATQVHWSMCVTGLRRWDVVALFGGNEWREYSLHYDEGIADVLMETCRRFWFDHVVADVAPPLDGSKSAHDYLARQFKKHTEVMRDGSRELEQKVLLLKDLREQRKEIEAGESQIEAELKAEIGDAAGIQGRNWKVTWKAAKSGGVDYKALAESLGATPEKIAQFTRPGSRRFLVSFPKED